LLPSIAFEATFLWLVLSVEINLLLEPPTASNGDDSISLTSTDIKALSGATSQYQATTYWSLIPKATLLVVFQIMYRSLSTDYWFPPAFGFPVE